MLYGRCGLKGHGSNNSVLQSEQLLLSETPTSAQAEQ